MLEEAVEGTVWAARKRLLCTGNLLGAVRGVFTKVVGEARVVILKCYKIYKTKTILHCLPKKCMA